MPGGGDPYGVLDLLPPEPEHATRHDGRHEGGEGGMMPAPLPDAGKGGFTQTHFELVAQDDPHDEVLARAPGSLPAGQRRRDDVRRVRGILLPVDVVVVHDPHHERVGQGRRHGIGLLAAAQDGRRARARDLTQYVQGDEGILLAVPSEGASKGVQEVTTRLVDGLLPDLVVGQALGPAGHGGGDGVRHSYLRRWRGRRLGGPGGRARRRSSA